MQELLTQIAGAWAATTPAEAGAAVLGLVYLVLAIRQHPWCWIAAFVSTVLYTWVFWRAGLRMQAALQLYYVAMAVYGWFAWRGDAARPSLPVSRASWRLQAAGLAGVAIATALTATWLGRESGSQQPVLDSLTTWASVFTTWLVVRKYLETWAWWFAIDALIAVLCWQQRLYPTALLYGLYLVLVFVGWREWRRDLNAPATAAATGSRA
jgi:nicotinamide mononucleotide transporter